MNPLLVVCCKVQQCPNTLSLCSSSLSGITNSTGAKGITLDGMCCDRQGAAHLCWRCVTVCLQQANLQGTSHVDHSPGLAASIWQSVTITVMAGCPMLVCFLWLNDCLLLLIFAAACRSSA